MEGHRLWRVTGFPSQSLSDKSATVVPTVVPNGATGGQLTAGASHWPVAPQVSPTAHDPQGVPQPSSPQALVPHSGTQTHAPSTQLSPEVQVPQVPSQPSSPQALPWHAF